MVRARRNRSLLHFQPHHHSGGVFRGIRRSYPTYIRPVSRRRPLRRIKEIFNGEGKIFNVCFSGKRIGWIRWEEYSRSYANRKLVSPVELPPRRLLAPSSGRNCARNRYISPEKRCLKAGSSHQQRIPSLAHIDEHGCLPDEPPPRGHQNDEGSTQRSKGQCPSTIIWPGCN